MTFLIYMFICLGFIVIQTALFPLLGWLGGFYDLLIPFVAYLGLSRPLKEGLPVVILIGIGMDTLSGGAFGIYSTTYFWFYAAIVWLIGFVHFKNRLLLPFVAVVGVLFENLVFLGAVKLASPGGSLPAGTLRAIVVQVLWAFFTCPLLLLLIRSVHLGWMRWTADKFGDAEA